MVEQSATAIPTDVDVAIIGAGPSATTLASLLCRHRPGTRVVAFEKERFPRFKIGESLVVDINRVLADMGVLQAVEDAGFIRKVGATFLWGDARDPVQLLWSEGAALVERPEGYHLDYTFHVDRPRYDVLLADNARSHGALVVEGCRVEAVEFEGERAVGVRVRPEGGADHVVRARWVVDCAGGHGPLTMLRAGKQVDQALRNIAIYGYLQGMHKTRALTGLPGAERTLILTHPMGWFWVIPISDTVTSVGFITKLDSFRAQSPTDPRAYFEARLRELPEFEPLFRDATLTDYRGDAKMVHTVSEFSYTCDRVWGPGWAVCGDAGGFVDAILSVGCFMGQTHAQFLAYSLASVLDGACEPELALGSYATVLGENLAAFRHVAYLFYAFNPSVHEWWQQCAAELRASTVVPEGDNRAAFVAFFTGFSIRSALYDDAIGAFGGSFLLNVGARIFGEAGRFAGESVQQDVDAARAFIGRNPKIRLRDEVRARPFALPKTGTGRLAPVVRLDFGVHGDADPADRRSAGGLPSSRRLYVPASLAHLPALMDGTRTLRELAADLAERYPELGADEAFREVAKVGYRLACMGAIDDTATRLP